MEALTILAGAFGVFFLYTHFVLGWNGLGLGPRRSKGSPWAVRRDWLAQAGLGSVRPSEFIAVSVAVSLGGASIAFIVFGGFPAALAAGAFTAFLPLAIYRSRRIRRRSEARQAWPRMIEEMRLQAGSLGRSVPQALIEVGKRGPPEMGQAFAALEREWLISTDFSRSLDVFKQHLADPTADTVAETLLVAHEIGGSGLDRRLADLADDRVLDLQGRKDAQSKQAGVRFARRFVLFVPMGMALAGMSIGAGRASYAGGLGQILVVVGIGAMVGCWLWAGRLMKLPDEDRVFGS
ncbi:MAG: type II secretion system F family protein [Acidimicrobiales bacterium]